MANQKANISKHFHLSLEIERYGPEIIKLRILRFYISEDDDCIIFKTCVVISDSIKFKFL